MARVHHGGRLHQDVLRAPVYFDLPSSLSPDLHERLSDSLRSQVLFGPDVLPTLFELAGHRGWAPANDTVTRRWAAPPAHWLLLWHPDKCVVTSLKLKPNGDSAADRAALAELGSNLVGLPVLKPNGNHLLAFERFDLSSDPTEAENLVNQETDGLASLLRSSWAQSISMPVAGKGEVDLATLLDGSQLLGAAG
ncbi:MAG TPA: hypothetical protein VMQ59_04900 [Acidimicrobiales bacterium]|jgi:hypothetical protein|nr:hypothetical protein [Acidimicrobiales bacterium]